MANISSSNGLEKRPKLRFPGFDEPWEIQRLSDFADRVTRKNGKNQSDLPLTISSKDGLVDQVSYFNKTVASKDMSGYYLLLNGEYAYNKSYSVGYDFGSIKRLDRYPMGALSTLYICFALKKHDSDFIKAYFDSLKWYREIYMISAEGARNHGLLNVPTDEFFETKHYLPHNISEQRKIADFIIALERRIDAQQALVDNLKKYKRGLVFSVFLSDNTYGIKVEATPLTCLLKEYRNRETANLRVCSVAVTKGVVDQLEHIGRRLSASDTSHYGRVKPGDVVYTKSPTGDFPYGIVKQSWLQEDVAVSPLYGVYTPLSYEAGYLIHTYFEQSNNANNYLRTLAQKGAKNTINITTAHFLDKYIPFPSSQTDIKLLVGLFMRITKRIESEECKLDRLMQQRKTLMQQLFI